MHSIYILFILSSLTALTSCLPPLTESNARSPHAVGLVMSIKERLTDFVIPTQRKLCEYCIAIFEKSKENPRWENDEVLVKAFCEGEDDAWFCEILVSELGFRGRKNMIIHNNCLFYQYCTEEEEDLITAIKQKYPKKQIQPAEEKEDL
eukprot:TRINITY_DN13709_c0_g1_i1.p1 TRINITY_DN13709_c0_g1~~TRINITY_DN13709_c0_g1_i1.p1  ORF type:complete len:149 (+),score=29.49 TRINITY_DN13709_c0_g1_i1:1-447(+)